MLEQAQAAYEQGRFDEALDRIASCVNDRPTSEQALTAYALRVRIHLLQDDAAAARTAAEQLLQVDPNFPLRADDPPRFASLIERLKSDREGTQVRSVSKTNESLLEAPATVVVITDREIRERGYLDLEAVLHDLPGFDISRVNGIHYSNVYQRGYRSDATSRTLLLIDGVEQNDLFSHVVDLSRQFPLSNIDRVEVIYGPASTMYGSNAFVGVINVLTKQADRILEPGKALGARVNAGFGAWNTKFVDATMAGSRGEAQFSLTARVYKSDEWDLSGDSQWDYDRGLYVAPDAIRRYARWLVGNFAQDAVDWRRLAQLDQAAYIAGVNGSAAAYTDLTDDWMVSAQLKLSNFTVGLQTWRRNEGIAAWSTDRAAPGAHNGNVWIPKQTAVHARYSTALPRGMTFSYLGQAKIHELGQGSSQFALNSYLDGPLGWQDHVVDTPAFWTHTQLIQSSTQIRNEVNLHVRHRDRFELVNGVELRNGVIQGNFVSTTNCVPVASTFTSVSDYRALNDAQVVEYVDRLMALIFRTPFGGRCTPTGAAVQFADAEAGEHFTVRDIGLFSQASYKATRWLKLIGGLRLDNNHIRPNAGFGTQTNLRLGALYVPLNASGDRVYAFKALYSEAFQDASSFEKYSTIPGIRETANPNLQPEKARNLELSAGLKWGRVSADVAAFRTSYSNRVALTRAHLADDPAVEAFLPDVLGALLSGSVRSNLVALLNRNEHATAAERILHEPIVTEQYENIGRQRVWGLQATSSYALGAYTLFGNYTFSNPVDLDPSEGGRRLKDAACDDVTSLRTPDIAQHRANVGVNARIGKWNVNFRVNAVGARPTMQSRLTLVEHTHRCGSPVLIAALRQFLEARVDTLSAQLGGATAERPVVQQPYAVAHTALTYDLTSRLAVQLAVHNLFDKEYAHPGPLNADGINWPTHVPQAPRAAFVQLISRF